MQLFKWRWIIFFSFSKLKRLQWQLKRRNLFFRLFRQQIDYQQRMNTRRTKSVLLCNKRHRNVFLFKSLQKNCYKYLGMLATQASHFCCSIIHRTSSKCEICARLRRVLCSTAILTKFYLSFDFELVIYECHCSSLIFKSSAVFLKYFSFFVGDDEWLCEAKVRLELEGSASLQEA